jgi:hypothetical protein
MADTVLRRGRRRSVERIAAAAAGYAAMGWPVCVGAQLPGRPHRGAAPGRACSCDRVGCPAPGAHPISPAWQVEASADPATVCGWWLARPNAGIILVTGRVFDVLDVPVGVGTSALRLMAAARVRPGPVALSAGRRAHFFVRTRGAPADEHEWWSCHLDCEPESVAQVSGLRWHCRDSYVLAPPSKYGADGAAQWLRRPADYPLPDGLRMLEFLADGGDGAAR